MQMVSSNGKNYKYFIGYKIDDYKIKTLCIMLPKTSGYVKSYDTETRWVFLLKLIVQKSNSIKTPDCEPIYHKTF